MVSVLQLLHGTTQVLMSDWHGWNIPHNLKLCIYTLVYKDL